MPPFVAFKIIMITKFNSPSEGGQASCKEFKKKYGILGVSGRVNPKLNVIEFYNLYSRPF